jgi:hypothetical protein
MKTTPMRDRDKAKKNLKIIGIKKAKALVAENGEEPVYPIAIVNEWKDIQIEKRLLKKQKTPTIVKHVGVCEKTVDRHRNRLFGFKSKKRISIK